ncbi:MAG: hypothetical protein ACRCYP_06280 [Alphaproteobacteria bacterium]
MTTPFYRSGDDVPQREIETMLGKEAQMARSITDHYPQTSTPDQVVQIGTFTKSTLQGLAKFCQLYRYDESIDHTISQHAVGALFSSGAITTSHVTIWIPSSGYIADLLNMLLSGKEIKEVIIRKLANIQKPNISTMEVKYTGCHLIYYKPDGNKTMLAFRYIKRTQTFTEYDQHGKKQGKTASILDLSTSKTGKK